MEQKVILFKSKGLISITEQLKKNNSRKLCRRMVLKSSYC